MIEDSQGSLTYEDILHKYTIPQLVIMRIDKPSVDMDYEGDSEQVNSAEGLFALINNPKR